MRLRIAKEITCYIKNDFHEFKEGDVIENATHEEVEFLLTKKKVAVIEEEANEEPDYGKAERENLINEAIELEKKGILPKRNWRKLPTAALKKIVSI
jgi:hypothetical protein